MKSKQIIVTGKVQGVGFRNFTLNIATELRIVGWARNLLSSEVEILALAPADKMEVFLTKIKIGPSRAKVESIEIIDVDSKLLVDNMSTFRIEPDGEKKRVF
jgi:acylphosphatase